MKLLYNIRRNRYLFSEMRKINKMIWRAETKKEAAVGILKDTDKEIGEKEAKLKTISKLIADERSESKADMEKLRDLAKQKADLEVEIEELKKNKANILRDISLLEQEMEGERKYIDIIKPMLKWIK